VRFDEAWDPDELAVKDFRFDDPTQTDTDSDGIDNCSEAALGTDALAADSDGDGITDGAEVTVYATDPRDYDSDDDGASDGAEVLEHATDPNEPDSDGDQLRDGFEIRYGFDPLAPGETSQDADGDGLDSFGEQGAGANPLVADSDSDGLSDGVEVHHHGTDPARADTDRDGLNDGFEIAYGFDPLSPGEGAQDPDGDGMRNVAEQERHTDPGDPDSDHDGLSDGAETSRIAALGFGTASTLGATYNHTLSILAADLDMDGDADVVTLDGKVEWFANRLNEPSRDFAPRAVIALDSSAGDAMAVGDLDGDGDPDVIATHSGGNEIAWYENRLREASTDFAPKVVVSSTVVDVRSVIAADLDRDGDLDIAYASPAGLDIGWYENRLHEPSADFAPARFVTRVAHGTWLLVAADLDHDGDLDILSGSQRSAEIAWYENRLGEDSRDFSPKRVIASHPEIGDAYSIFASDIDGDADLDVLAALGDRIVWFENRLRESSADFGDVQTISTQVSFAETIFSADLDGDGDPEALSTSFGDRKLAWYSNRLETVDSGFGPQQVISLVPGFIRSTFAADLDGDGDPDVLAPSYQQDTVAWYENPGTDPNDPDTDGDGFADGYEFVAGCDPITAGQCLPEPGSLAALVAGSLLLSALARRRNQPSPTRRM
jgi:hypothetical protein